MSTGSISPAQSLNQTLPRIDGGSDSPSVNSASPGDGGFTNSLKAYQAMLAVQQNASTVDDDDSEKKKSLLWIIGGVLATVIAVVGGGLALRRGPVLSEAPMTSNVVPSAVPIASSPVPPPPPSRKAEVIVPVVPPEDRKKREGSPPPPPPPPLSDREAEEIILLAEEARECELLQRSAYTGSGGLSDKIDQQNQQTIGYEPLNEYREDLKRDFKFRGVGMSLPEVGNILYAEANPENESRISPKIRQRIIRIKKAANIPLGESISEELHQEVSGFMFSQVFEKKPILTVEGLEKIKQDSLELAKNLLEKREKKGQDISQFGSYLRFSRVIPEIVDVLLPLASEPMNFDNKRLALLEETLNQVILLFAKESGFSIWEELATGPMGWKDRTKDRYYVFEKENAYCMFAYFSKLIETLKDRIQEQKQ